MTLKELREKRAKLTADVRAIKDKADLEKRKMNGEEVGQADKFLDEIEGLCKEIRGIEEAEASDQLRTDRISKALADVDASRGRRSDPGQPSGGNPGERRRHEAQTPEQRTARSVEYRAAFSNWLRRGNTGIHEDDRNILVEHLSAMDPEVRDQGVGTGAAGGYTVAPLFQAQMSDAMKLFQGPRQAGSEHITGGSGADLPFPSNDDTSNVASIVAEAAAVGAGTDLTIAQTTISTYMYSTGVVKVSIQLLNDSAFNIDSYLSGKLAERMGRGTNAHWTTGTGSSQPQGIVTALNSGSGIGKTTASATAITADEVLQLQHSVDPAYRINAKYAMSDGILSVIRLLKDSQGRYLLNEPTQGAPGTIWGKPFEIFTGMQATAATGTVTMLFGDFKHYKTREIAGMGIFRFDQLYMANLQVGFMAFGRFGGGFVNPGNYPIKCLKQA